MFAPPKKKASTSLRLTHTQYATPKTTTKQPVPAPVAPQLSSAAAAQGKKSESMSSKKGSRSSRSPRVPPTPSAQLNMNAMSVIYEKASPTTRARMAAASKDIRTRHHNDVSQLFKTQLLHVLSILDKDNKLGIELLPGSNAGKTSETKREMHVLVVGKERKDRSYVFTVHMIKPFYWPADPYNPYQPRQTDQTTHDTKEACADEILRRIGSYKYRVITAVNYFDRPVVFTKEEFMDCRLLLSRQHAEELKRAIANTKHTHMRFKQALLRDDFWRIQAHADKLDSPLSKVLYLYSLLRITLVHEGYQFSAYPDEANEQDLQDLEWVMEWIESHNSSKTKQVDALIEKFQRCHRMYPLEQVLRYPEHGDMKSLSSNSLAEMKAYKQALEQHEEIVDKIKRVRKFPYYSYRAQQAPEIAEEMRDALRWRDEHVQKQLPANVPFTPTVRTEQKRNIAPATTTKTTQQKKSMRVWR